MDTFEKDSSGDSERIAAASTEAEDSFDDVRHTLSDQERKDILNYLKKTNASNVAMARLKCKGPTAAANRKKPSERGSGCFIPFIVLFALTFIIFAYDGLWSEAVLSFFLTALFLRKYLSPAPVQKTRKPPDRSYFPADDDGDDLFDLLDKDDPFAYYIIDEMENGRM